MEKGYDAMLLKEEWDRLLKDEKRIYIYGAGKYGKKILRQLKRDDKDEYVQGFIVSDKTKNPEMIEGKAVVQSNELDEKNGLILVAVSDQYQDEIIKLLEKLHFTKFVNAYKYVFLEYDNENAIDIVNVWELLQKQFENECFFRFDIMVRLLAIEEYFGENDFGMSLYRKMQNARIRVGYADIAEERFRHLIKSWEEGGYDVDSPIIVDKDFRIIDGSHRLALALYFRCTYIKVRKIDECAITDFGMDWFDTYFESNECKKIVEKFDLIVKDKNYNTKSEEEKLREEIYLILGKNQDFGRGQFYQSLEEIGVKGQRPTEKRIDIYGLKNLVRGKRVFDIGCNCGFMDICLGLVAQSVNGIEYNSTLIKTAECVKKFLGRENVFFEVGDFKEYVPSEKYDIIFSFAVHQWIGMPIEKYCEKVILMLTRGGYLFFESQDVNKDIEFEKYCFEFEDRGLEKVRDGRICDDGKIERKFVIYKYKEDNGNGKFFSIDSNTSI